MSERIKYKEAIDRLSFNTLKERHHALPEIIEQRKNLFNRIGESGANRWEMSPKVARKLRHVKSRLKTHTQVLEERLPIVQLAWDVANEIINEAKTYEEHLSEVETTVRDLESDPEVVPPRIMDYYKQELVRLQELPQKDIAFQKALEYLAKNSSDEKNEVHIENKTQEVSTALDVSESIPNSTAPSETTLNAREETSDDTIADPTEVIAHPTPILVEPQPEKEDHLQLIKDQIFESMKNHPLVRAIADLDPEYKSVAKILLDSLLVRSFYGPTVPQIPELLSYYNPVPIEEFAKVFDANGQISEESLRSARECIGKLTFLFGLNGFLLQKVELANQPSGWVLNYIERKRPADSKISHASQETKVNQFSNGGNSDRNCDLFVSPTGRKSGIIFARAYHALTAGLTEFPFGPINTEVFPRLTYQQLGLKIFQEERWDRPGRLKGILNPISIDLKLRGLKISETEEGFRIVPIIPNSTQGLDLKAVEAELLSVPDQVEQETQSQIDLTTNSLDLTHSDSDTEGQVQFKTVIINGEKVKGKTGQVFYELFGTDTIHPDLLQPGQEVKIKDEDACIAMQINPQSHEGIRHAQFVAQTMKNRFNQLYPDADIEIFHLNIPKKDRQEAGTVGYIVARRKALEPDQLPRKELEVCCPINSDTTRALISLFTDPVITEQFPLQRLNGDGVLQILQTLEEPINPLTQNEIKQNLSNLLTVIGTLEQAGKLEEWIDQQPADVQILLMDLCLKDQTTRQQLKDVITSSNSTLNIEFKYTSQPEKSQTTYTENAIESKSKKSTRLEQLEKFDTNLHKNIDRILYEMLGHYRRNYDSQTSADSMKLLFTQFTREYHISANQMIKLCQQLGIDVDGRNSIYEQTFSLCQLGAVRYVKQNGLNGSRIVMGELLHQFEEHVKNIDFREEKYKHQEKNR